MTWAIRSVALAAGAAALLSTQAVYAAPVRAAPAVDPLVSLSILSSAQSQALVCGPGASCALPTTLGAAATSPALAMSTATTAAVQDTNGQGKRVNTLLLILAFLILLGIGAAILSGGGDGDGNLSPISPG